MAKERRRNVGVEAFTDDDNDDLEVASNDDDADESEGYEMSKETAKAKGRKKAEVEEEEDEDDEEVKDEITDDDDVDDDEDDDEDEDDPNAFTPWIFHEEATWTLDEAFKNVDSGDPVIIYDADNDRWYKMMPIRVGELPETSDDGSA